jgi:uncharacterized Ntn-hydrolase superfamily protein
MVGVVIASSSPAVAARCAYVRAGVGAVATQNLTDPRLGSLVLDQLQSGRSASEAVASVIGQAPGREYRQLAAVDAIGRTGAFSGTHTLGTYNTVHGNGAVASGNLLASQAVIEAMVREFGASAGQHLGDRLNSALKAALEAGGEAGPVRSAGLLIADRVEWPVADLRVDWHDEPIRLLADLWRLWRPEMDAYVARALRPEEAPAFGMQGETTGKQ